MVGANTLSVSGEIISVRISPGAIELTRMPKGMDATADDRAHVDDGALAALHLLEQPARQQRRREDIHLEHLGPGFDQHRHPFQPFATGAFGGSARVADQSVD